MPDDLDDIGLLLRCQFLPHWNGMPFGKAVGAACRRGMLGYESGDAHASAFAFRRSAGLPGQSAWR